MLTLVFLFAGATGGLSGGLFASLQSYITPDAFTIDLSILFFIAILIGGRGSILGPLCSTVLLTLLPEVAAPLAAWASFLYATLLLAIVLLAPGGFANLFDFRNRKPLETGRIIRPNEAMLPAPVVSLEDAGPDRRRECGSELWRRARDRWPQSGHHARRGARADRPERFRQDHGAQRDFGLLPA